MSLSLNSQYCTMYDGTQSSLGINHHFSFICSVQLCLNRIYSGSFLMMQNELFEGATGLIK